MTDAVEWLREQAARFSEHADKKLARALEFAGQVDVYEAEMNAYLAGDRVSRPTKPTRR